MRPSLSASLRVWTCQARSSNHSLASILVGSTFNLWVWGVALNQPLWVSSKQARSNFRGLLWAARRPLILAPPNKC